MRVFLNRGVGALACALSLALVAPAQAQLLDSVLGSSSGGSTAAGASGGGGGLLGGGLQGGGGLDGILGGATGLGGASGVAGAGLGALGVPALESVGMGNLTGVLQYCIKQRYVNGAESLQQSLLGKLGGEQQAQADPGYQQGLAGLLGGGSQSSQPAFDLSREGLQKQASEKVCEYVLDYGKSLL